MRKKISKRQHDTYEFIKAFMLKNNVTPSIREIAEGIGLNSISPVHYHIKALIEAGLIIPYGDNSIRYSVKGLKIVEETADDTKSGNGVSV